MSNPPIPSPPADTSPPSIVWEWLRSIEIRDWHVFLMGVVVALLIPLGGYLRRFARFHLPPSYERLGFYLVFVTSLLAVGTNVLLRKDWVPKGEILVRYLELALCAILGFQFFFHCLIVKVCRERERFDYALANLLRAHYWLIDAGCMAIGFLGMTAEIVADQRIHGLWIVAWVLYVCAWTGLWAFSEAHLREELREASGTIPYEPLNSIVEPTGIISVGQGGSAVSFKTNESPV